MKTIDTIASGAAAHTLVAAVAGKIIVVRSLLIAATTVTLSASVRLKSASTVLTPWLRAAGTATFQFESERGLIQTAVGEALNGENPLADSAVVLVEYELVDG